MSDELKAKLKQSGVDALKNLADYAGKTESEKARLVRTVVGESELDHAHKMGVDYRANGPNEINCDFRIFATREQAEAWERGFEGKEAKDADDKAE